MPFSRGFARDTQAEEDRTIRFSTTRPPDRPTTRPFNTELEKPKNQKEIVLFWGGILNESEAEDNETIGF